MTLYITKKDIDGNTYFDFTSVNKKDITRFGAIIEKYADKTFKMISKYEDIFEVIKYTDNSDCEKAEIPDWLEIYLEERHNGPFYFTYKTFKNNI